MELTLSRKKNLPYAAHPCASIEAVKAAAARADIPLSPPTVEELTLATELVRDHSRVEVPGKWNRNGDFPSEAIVLPEPRSKADFVIAPCKHEVSLMRQTH